MKTIVGVKFKKPGKMYYFDPQDLELEVGTKVIVETALGDEYGEIMIGNKEIKEENITSPLKKVIRIATDKDTKSYEEYKKKEPDALKKCQEKIEKHGLDMKLVDAEYKFDGSKLIFYFTADGRIDFRELVKDLAAVFKTRIELRQIGVRDETKVRGGYSICGRPLCCSTYLTDFVPVSIKMAKEQNLSLNPTKISGVCGRLMCCLKNEEETYEELNSRLPAIGDTVTTNDGLKGEVQTVSVLRQLVKVLVEVNDEKEIREYKAEDLKFKRRKRHNSENINDEELKALEALERKEGKSKIDD